jgi:hypothetical protein
MSGARGRKAQDSAETTLTTDQKASLIAGGLTLGLATAASSVMLPSILEERRRNRKRRKDAAMKPGSDIKPIKPSN